VRRLVLTPTYGSYGDVELLSDLLVSMGGVYNVYREGGSIVLELDDGVSPAEVDRRVLDLGHELVLPHFVFVAKPNQDEKTVVKWLMESPYVVAAEYYPRSGRGVLAAVRGTAEEEVAKFERSLGQVCTRGVHLRSAH
jgi:hypothetical protein